MILVLTLLLLIAALPLYALPATLSLQAGARPGVEPLTISAAARRLMRSGLKGRPLVEAARRMVADRMQYCRRNSFDTAATAFARGYGYCQQQAFALARLLCCLGFEARVVHAFRNRLPDGTVTPHAWVRVAVDGEMLDVDSIHYDPGESAIAFTPEGKVRGYSPAFRILAGWGSTAVNAHRYYATGREM